MTIRQQMLECQSDVDSNNDAGTTIELIKERYNCTTAEISDNGRVWIENPMTGRWLSDEEVSDLIDWIHAR